ncbi:MAG TPA: zinc-binding alcohol dehydrogenase [Dermatophilaceae bacterium]|nr:zinc-binding alcohol dehydrogenase [Dermatophilaceae bacterium]
MTLRATAYWTVAPGRGELRDEPIMAPGPEEALISTLHSGISRGTELVVHRGQVPSGVAARMRAPFQEGHLPGPVKYGYLSVGRVEQGPADLRGRTVFCLYPHQDRYVVPVASLTPVPDGVPAARAVLAGTVETALNALWDAPPRLGDRVAVLGAGMVGCSVAALLATCPLDRLELVDVDPERAAVAAALAVPFRAPEQAADGCDLVFHCSASSEGLNRGLELLGEQGSLVELSWYGDRPVTANLGADFHARRLRIQASQVGIVGHPRRDHAERLATALRLLADPRFDALISGHTAFADLPDTMDRLASGSLRGLCHVVDYDASPTTVQPPEA